MWFSASMESPVAIEASPMTATTRCASPRASRACASPSASEQAVPAWPVVKWSCALSYLLQKPISPPRFRSRSKVSRRPVTSLWA